MPFISASQDLFSTVYTCLSSAAVGKAVYLSASDAVDDADGTDNTKMPAIGFINSKPTTTSCIVQYDGEVTGLSGLTAGTLYYFGATGGLTSSTSGLTTIQTAGIAKDTTTLIMINTGTGGQTFSGLT